MSRPLLYMDVDGVLNTYASPSKDPRHFEHLFDSYPRGLDRDPLLIRVPLRTSERVRLLEEHFEMVWATTWGERAPRLLSPTLGFGAEWPVLEITHQGAHPLVPLRRMSSAFTEKLVPLLHHAGDRPLAFVDDEVEGDARQALARRDREVAPSLLVEPRPAGGLSDRHVRRLLEFAERAT